MDIIRKLLNKANVIVAKGKTVEEERLHRGELFNIFQVCGVNHYEVTHSAIIAEMLSPKGSHGQGIVFLKEFIETIADNNNIVVDFNVSDVVVETEKVVGTGRIDIFVSNSSNQVIIIENKIYAQDQQEQLKRYEDYIISQGYNENQYYILYLSLDGHESEDGNKQNVKYIPISYSVEILDWLKKCKLKAIDKLLIRETITQYINHIKKLTNTDDNMDTQNNKELLDLLISNSNATLKIIQSEHNIIKTLIEECIFEELKQLGAEVDCEFKKDSDFHDRIIKNLRGKRSYPGFWFESEKYKCTIRFEFQDAYLSGSIGGLPKDFNEVWRKRLNCFKRSSQMWPGGYNNLDSKYSNWTLETLFNIKNNIQDFKAYIKGFLESVFKTIEESVE